MRKLILIIGIAMAFSYGPDGECSWTDHNGRLHRVFYNSGSWNYQSPNGTQVITQAYAKHLCAMH